MRLWRKSASPEPAAAVNAAAGARYSSAQERLKGDAQETARQRLVVASALFAVIFVSVGLRMSYVSLLRDGAEPTQRVAARGGSIQSERADIVDRNGTVLATSVPVMSAFVNPRLLLDPQDAARKIVTALPDLKYDEVREKLESDKTFVWVKRGLTPREHDRVNRLGIPGLEFQAEERRIYPQGTSAAHILGYASVDNAGLAGVERFFDQQLQSGEPVQLAIDLRLQRMVEREIVRAVQKFSAIGATAIVMDATNGEVLAMASLPTFDPEQHQDADQRGAVQPRHARRLRAGLDLQDLQHRHGARYRQGDVEQRVRRYLPDQDRPLHHQRRPCAAPAAHRPGALQVLVQHRLGQDGG